jgi:phosphate ABC transporter permease protein PstC/phosphate ABC transporter permease subunit PstA
LDRRRARRRWSVYPGLYWAGASVFALVVVALVMSLATGSAQAFAHAGLGFVWSGTWNPAANQYGAGTLIVGTVITTGVAMLLTVPIGLGVAVFMSELAPTWLAGPLSAVIEFLAAVPSIVVGLWALLVLSPVFASHVEPTLASIPGLHWLFGGPAYGPSVLLAAVVLAIMTLPTMVTLSRTALSGVARTDREAARALGGTRWQVICTAVLPGAGSGIAAAVTLAVGRALGEAIAVAMVIGNRPAIPHSLLAPGATLGSAIVNQFAEASPGLATSSVIALGAVLLILTVAVNMGGQALLRRDATPKGPLPAGPPATTSSFTRLATPDPSRAVDRAESGQLIEGWRQTVRSSSVATLPRRRLSSRLGQLLCSLTVLAGLAPLVALLYYTVARGARTISGGFLIHAPAPPGVPGGGISTAIAGTAKIVGIALVIAIPVGLFTALLLHERRGRLAGAIRFSADVLTGVPSILIGIFAYTIVVRRLHHFSTLAGVLAIAVLMTPIMIRANEEALRTVAVDLREAGVALGAPRARVARSVVVRTALPGVVSGNLLAAARGVGETAPLLFTIAAPTLAMTLLIFTQATEAYHGAQQTAWAAALVLLAAVLCLSVVARVAAWALTRRAR